MSDEFYACAECGAEEEFKQVFAMKIGGHYVEVDEPEEPREDVWEVQKCKQCDTIEPETFMYASWSKEDDV